MPQPASNANRIVVGVDGSEESKQALRWADYLAELTGSSITAVGAWTGLPAAAWAITGTGAISPEVFADAARASLTEALEDVFEADKAAGITTDLQEGSAASVLVHASEGALMLVVGSRGHGGFTGLLLGSVSSACAEHAKCPVFVVHGTNLPTLTQTGS
jgi:nucleotide-binding universal stress UspA family protein